MLTYLLSYYRIMPVFVEYIFPTVYLDKSFPPDPNIPDQAQDVYFSGLDEDHHLGHKHCVNAVEELGRSSRSVRLCYNIRSVERSEREPTSLDLHWSIKPMTVYHDFDVENGKALWITCKSSRDLKRELDEWVNDPEYPETATRSDRFLATLRTHVLFCKWAAGNWKWYLKELERQVQDIAESAQNADIDTYDGPATKSQSTIVHASHWSGDPAKDSSASSEVSQAKAMLISSFHNLFKSAKSAIKNLSPRRRQSGSHDGMSTSKPGASTQTPPNHGKNKISRVFSSPNHSNGDIEMQAQTVQLETPLRRATGIPKIGTGLRRSSDLASPRANFPTRNLPNILPPGLQGGVAQTLQEANNTPNGNTPSVPSQPPTTATSSRPLPDTLPPDPDSPTAAGAEATQERPKKKIPGMLPPDLDLSTVAGAEHVQQRPGKKMPVMLPPDMDPSAVTGADAMQESRATRQPHVLPTAVNARRQIRKKKMPDVRPPNVHDNQGTVLQLFPFKDVQKVQILGEKAQETLLVLQMNLEVLDELKSQYELVTSDPSFPQDLNRDCRAALIWFFKAIGRVEKDFRKQMNRAESVQKLLEDRKNFVSQTGNYLMMLLI